MKNGSVSNAKLSGLNEADGPVFKIKDDPRFFKIGKFLSHTGLDELPQLINVLKGDMALIGPRPLPVDEAMKIEKKYQKRTDVLPGIISPWVINGHHKMKFDEWMRSDIEYIKNKSFLTDINLVFKAFFLLIALILRESFDILTRFLKNGLLFL